VTIAVTEGGEGKISWGFSINVSARDGIYAQEYCKF
jgi:hypothetical protein